MTRFIMCLFIALSGGAQQPYNGVSEKFFTKRESWKIRTNQTAYSINQNHLKTLIPGKIGFPKPIMITGDHSIKQVSTGPRKIIRGVSYLMQIKEDVVNGVETVKSKQNVNLF